MNATTPPNDAKRFLKTLYPKATSFTFQTFDDNKNRKDPKLTRVLHGSLEEHHATLAKLNAAGAGIYVTINETDGKGRKADNIVRVRAWFVDLDGAPLPPVQRYKRKPHIIVETSPKRFAGYWLAKDAELDQFTPIQKGLIATFDGDPAVHDLPRVMRLPGYLHRKGLPFRSRIVQLNTHEPFSPDAFDDIAIGDDELHLSGDPIGDPQRIARALAVIPNKEDDDWATWNKVAMATYAASGGSDDGFKAFDEWSQKWSGYSEKNTLKRWQALKGSPPNDLGMGTLVRLAGLANRKWDETITLDDFHAYVPENKFIYVPTGDLWSAASVDSQLPKIAIKPNKTMKASARLNKNKPTHQRAWAPGEPEVVRGRLFKDGAWESKLGHNCFNLYRPPTIIIPEGKIDATPWEQHVQRVYKDHAAHIINYLAHRVQKPGEKPNHALVMVGSPGCGKDTLLEPVRYAVGPWNVASIRPKDLFEQFNEYVQSVLLIINETRDLGEASRTEFYEHMKTYTAAPPSVLRCNPKHLSPFYVMNVCGVIYPTNHANGLYLPADDRRHYVASTDVTADDLGGEKYFNELWEWYYKKQGFEHVAAFLAKHPLEDFNPFAPPPKTEAFWTMVRAHQSVEEDDLAQAIDTLGTPAALTLDCLRDTAPALKEWIDDNLRGPAIPNLLRQHDYVAFPNPGDKTKGLWFIAGDRQRVYVQRMLDGRGQHDALKALKTRREKRVTKKGVDDLI